MAYNIKGAGRKKANIKYRSISYVTPKGFRYVGKRGNKLRFVKKDEEQI